MSYSARIYIVVSCDKLSCPLEVVALKQGSVPNAWEQATAQGWTQRVEDDSERHYCPVHSDG